MENILVIGIAGGSGSGKTTLLKMENSSGRQALVDLGMELLNK